MTMLTFRNTIITTAAAGVAIAGISVPATANETTPTYDPAVTVMVDCKTVVVSMGATAPTAVISAVYTNNGTEPIGFQSATTHATYEEDFAISGTETPRLVTVLPGKSTKPIRLGYFTAASLWQGSGKLSYLTVAFSAADTEFADIELDSTGLCDRYQGLTAPTGSKFGLKFRSTCTVGFPVHRDENCLKQSESVFITNKSKKAAKVQILGEIAAPHSAFPEELTAKTVKVKAGKTKKVSLMSHRAGETWRYFGKAYDGFDHSTFHVEYKNQVIGTKLAKGFAIPWWTYTKVRSGV